jgi:phosphopantothenoylcysteine decarboxylase / phosphopantothenate---cysteine ligase
MLNGKRIVLVICGGIAAYKSLDLIRRLREREANVRVVMTRAAENFATPMAVAALSGQRVHSDLFSLTEESEMGHIELSRAADLIVLAPATADILAKMANGLADDLPSTLLLATDTKVLVAPAMNVRMWLHPAMQRNVNRLMQDGVTFCGPAVGDMACGEFGPGRMKEPLEIVAQIETLLQSPTKLPLPDAYLDPSEPGKQGRLLAGKHVIVTSGPTHEPIDPVRYIANRSSGRQGHAIAAAAHRAGARVTLVSGPVQIAAPQGVEVVSVETAQQMLQAVESALPADVFISTAAVADWRVANAATGKVKKSAAGPPELKLVENPDILATIAQMKAGRPNVVVGFAAETSDIEHNGKAKLAKKKCDLIVANDVRPESGIMGGEFNSVHLISAAGIESWPSMTKDDVATQLIERIARKVAKDQS